MKNLGFTVNEQTEEQNSETIEEGYVIKTNPETGVSRKKGTTITLIISAGVNGVTLENYVGMNFFEIKGKLEAYGLKVVKEEKDVEKNEETIVTENEILEQRPIAGTKLVEGDTITFVIPNMVINYPNFVEEKWTKEAIENFCKEYGISVEFVEEETNSYEPGTVIKQDRVAGTRVREGYPLRITLAKEKEKPTINTTPIDENQTTDDNQENTNQNTEKKKENTNNGTEE